MGYVRTERGTEPTNLTFQTEQHSRLFLILLGDFLSEARVFKGEPVPLGLKKAPSNARPTDRTFLFHLRQVCAGPKLGSNTTALRKGVETFADWLEGDFVKPGVNLCAIDVVADVRIKRYRYIKMCGDIAKHNLARLSANVAHLRRLLGACGHNVSEQQAYLAVEGFFERFGEDVFIYHSSQIAEFLNNIRWAIFEYLEPEYQRSWHRRENATHGLGRYGYEIPAEINEPVAKAMYWEVMNKVRTRPWVQRFIVSSSLKQRY